LWERTLDIEADTVDRYLSGIKKHWHVAANSIMQASVLCAKANVELDVIDKRKLISALPFARPTFSKLVAIGRDKRLLKREVQRLLPPNYSTIYEISHLDDSQLKQAIESKVLKPTVRRADIVAWREGSVEETRKLPLYASLRLTKELSSRKMNSLRKDLDALANEYELELSRPEDAHSQKLRNSDQRMQSFIVRKARELIKRSVRIRSQGKTKAQRKKLFHADEMEIDSSMTESEILQVLIFNGCEDGFENIRQEAYKKYVQVISPYRYWPSEGEAEIVISENLSGMKKRKFGSEQFRDFK
jgi:hypothetical protein